MRRLQVYIVIGIDLEGRKDLLGFYVKFGRESKSKGVKEAPYGGIG